MKKIRVERLDHDEENILRRVILARIHQLRDVRESFDGICHLEHFLRGKVVLVSRLSDTGYLLVGIGKELDDSSISCKENQQQPPTWPGGCARTAVPQPL